jgi:hypothetical protein
MTSAINMMEPNDDTRPMITPVKAEEVDDPMMI